jgi:hypothetical protein
MAKRAPVCKSAVNSIPSTDRLIITVATYFEHFLSKGGETENGALQGALQCHRTTH